MTTPLSNVVNRFFGRLVNLEKKVNQLSTSSSSNSSGDPLIWRTYDGSGNNLSQPDWGKAGVALLRKAIPPAYANGTSSLVVRSSTPRIISNAVCKSSGSKLNSLGLTDMTWVWGQFLDHEIDLTETNASEPANMTTPSLMTDPTEEYPDRTILFDRSQSVFGTSPREQPNSISAFIDATNVYGASSTRALTLRLLDGSGKMITGTADNGEILPPYNTFGLANAMPTGSTASDFFIAGDIRANENIFLTAMHTLFIREHNRLCDQIILDHPNWSDELIFQEARRIVAGIMQKITYDEYLPGLLGINSIPDYTGYNNGTNPGIHTEFSTAAYRLGHSMLSNTLKTDNGSGTISLLNSFFNPSYLQTNGASNLLLGAAKQVMQEIDTEVVDDIRNFLFGMPTMTNLLDLASLNIQRGRDHGIPGYNDVREAYGLTRKQNFSDITTDSTLATALSNIYTGTDEIDPWIGCLAEDHLSGKAVGELLETALVDQFIRLRDGDRFWYENDPGMSTYGLNVIKNTRLSDVINRNTSGISVQKDVFHL